MLDVIKKHLRQSFSTDSEHPETLGNVLIRQLVILGCIIVIALILKPDLYGLIPNSLDPIFYTGYAINLDDALAAAGNRHYFVTRWSSYMPQYVFCQIFGAYWGRIALRLVMLAILSEVFWRIGKRFRFSAQSRVIATLLVFMMPMFVRAFTTDYQEYSSTFYGILLVSIACTQVFNWKWAGTFGALAALMVISNPFNFFLIASSGLIWFINNLKKARIRQHLMSCLVMTLTAIGVLLFGYALFKYHYHIENVYTPTIRFIRTYVSPERDLWTAPGRQWLLHFGWLSIPLLTVFVSTRVIKAKTNDVHRIVRTIQINTVVIFLYHVFMQVSKGHALETSYYWAMALPSTYLLLLLVIGTLLSAGDRFIFIVSSLLVALALIHFEIPNHLHLGAGLPLLISLVFFIFGVNYIFERSVLTAAHLFVVGLLWIQIGSPPYNTRTYGGDLNSPRYDLVYGHNSAISNQVLHETIWFTDVMDKIPDDWKSTFMSAGGWSSAIVGTYIPHPFSRWIVPQEVTQPLSEIVKDELEFGSRKYLVLFGDKSEVGSLIPGLRMQLPRLKVLIDEIHQSALKYRLLVVEGNSEVFGKVEMAPGILDRNLGKVMADGSVYISEASPVGYATFGPYFTLTEGDYRVQLRYECTKSGPVGTFEMYSDARGSGYSREVVCSTSRIQSMMVPFRVGSHDRTWQIRTEYRGKVSIKLNMISLERLSRS